MLDQTDTRRGNLFFYLRGKALSDPAKGTPDRNAVRTDFRFNRRQRDTEHLEEDLHDSLLLIKRERQENQLEIGRMERETTWMGLQEYRLAVEESII